MDDRLDCSVAGTLSGCRATVWCILASSLVSACQLAPHRVAACPLNFEQQSAEVLSIAPLGTPRDVTIERLGAAGFRGDFAHMSTSIYYCDLWERPDGARWHTRVALLFDEAGLLYATRPSDSTVTANPSQGSAGAQVGSSPSTSSISQGRRPIDPTASAPNDSETSSSGARSGARTPVGAL